MIMRADEEKKTRRPHFLLLFFAALGAVALIAALSFVVLVVAVVSSFSGSNGFLVSGSSLHAVHGEKIVAGIRLEGEVNPEMATEIVDMLEEAADDKNVAGVLLDVNSPGGSVVASQEIYDTVARLRETIPVVVYVREMAASGAYYASASASRIVANRGSMLGSIGVILSTVETSELIKWAKLKPVTLKTGALKDAGSPMREWTPADREYLQQLIEDTRKIFVADVKATRKISDEAAARLSDGRVVLGAEALTLKLVDAIGSRNDALVAAAGLAGIKGKPELIYIKRKKPFAELFNEVFNEEALSNVFRKAISDALLSSESAQIRAR
jgi:protease-4